jgi:hypothetical protein
MEQAEWAVQLRTLADAEHDAELWNMQNVLIERAQRGHTHEPAAYQCAERTIQQQASEQ